MRRRLVIFYLIIFFILIMLYSLFFKKKEVDENIKENTIISDKDFESNKNITILRTKTGKIQDLNLNYYMLCVIASEMPFKFEFEALKAQAVVARTYLYNKIINNKEDGADVCDNFAHCQAFNDIDVLENIWKNEKGYSEEEIKVGEEKIKRAILETDGQIIEYKGEIIDALFHSSSYLKTEDASAIWSHENVPYLQSVESIEEPYDNSSSEDKISFATLKNTLIENGYVDDLSNDQIKNMNISSYTKSGRVEKISIGSYLIDATVFRTLFNIKSTNFTFSIDSDLQEIIFDVKGFGHGVGMSQVGADTYAKQGYNYQDIIHHYYTNVDIVNINK